MLLGVPFTVDAAILLIAIALQTPVMHRLFSESQRKTRLYYLAVFSSSALLSTGIALTLAFIYGIRGPIPVWIRGICMGWGLAMIAAAAIGFVLTPVSKTSQDRRRWLNIAAKGAISAPLAGMGFGMFIERDHFEVNEVSIPIPGLPADLDGLRILQLTDIHLGPFLSEKVFSRVVDMANETKPHVAVVTGDLISYREDPIDAAIRQVARLRADAGILGCHGNHEVYSGVSRYATEECARRGVRILRMQNESLRFGSASLNFAGVDYQRMRSVYLTGAEKLVKPGNLNILLSHNPDVFPVAAGKGFGLTLAGHTHGGQINFEILDSNINVAQFMTPYTKGLYRKGPSAVYVSSGIGTIGVPVRFGARPEVTLIRLCAI